MMCPEDKVYRELTYAFIGTVAINVLPFIIQTVVGFALGIIDWKNKRDIVKVNSEKRLLMIKNVELSTKLKT